MASKHFLALVIMVVLVEGCAGPPAPTASTSPTAVPEVAPRTAQKRIVAAIRGYPKSLSVAIDAAGSGSTAGIREVEQLLNDGLGKLDFAGQLQPLLAESVPSLENGQWKLFPDGRMETTWRLRAGSTWQDGTPFTADDLVFTTAIARDRTLTFVFDPAFEAVESVEAPNLSTLVMRWKQPYINADKMFSAISSGQSVLPIPRHLLEAPYAADRSTFTQVPYWGPEFVGTGPYRMKEFVSDAYMIVAANDRYHRGRPKLDEIEIRFLGDFNVMVANILSGAVEVTFGRGLSYEQGIEARDRWPNGRMEVALSNVSALWPQFLNPSPAVVAQLPFRRAMLHALDRKQLSDVLQGGVSPIADSVVGPSDPDYQAVQSSAVPYAYDPARTSQLLESLGYTRGPDGLARDAAGQPLTVKIQTTPDDLREKMLPVIGDYWRQVGVTTEPVIISRQASNDRQLRSEFAAFDFTRQPGDPTRYHSAQAPVLENNYRGNNRNRYRSAELDALIDRYFVTIPTDERLQVLGQMVHHISDQVVLLGVFYIAEPTLVTNRLRNFVPRKVDDAVDTWNAQEWDI